MLLFWRNTSASPPAAAPAATSLTTCGKMWTRRLSGVGVEAGVDRGVVVEVRVHPSPSAPPPTTPHACRPNVTR